MIDGRGEDLVVGYPCFYLGVRVCGSGNPISIIGSMAYGQWEGSQTGRGRKNTQTGEDVFELEDVQRRRAALVTFCLDPPKPETSLARTYI